MANGTEGRPPDRGVRVAAPDRSEDTGSATRPHVTLLLSPDQAAASLAISRRSLYRLLAAGRLGSVMLGGSRRIPLASLQRLVGELQAAGSHSEAS